MSRLIGVCGRLHSGKDTIGKYLIEKHGFAQTAFANPLKEFVWAVVEELHLPLTKDEIGWNGVDWTGPKSPTGRHYLQAFGHLAREKIARDVWIRAFQQNVLDVGLPLVVTDARYPNEVEAIRQLGGEVWRVVRPGIDRRGLEHQHPTEVLVDTLEVDWEVVNDGTLIELYAKVDVRLRAS